MRRRLLRLALARDEDLADARKALGVAHALEHLVRVGVRARVSVSGLGC